jgi:hypothetical protein
VLGLQNDASEYRGDDREFFRWTIEKGIRTVSDSVFCVLGGSESPNSLTSVLLRPTLISSQATVVKTFQDATVRDTEIWRPLYQAGHVRSRHVCGGQYLQCPALSGMGFLRSCYTPFRTSAETRNSYFIGYEHQHCFCNLCFEAISLLVKKFVSVRNFNASINSVPDGSKENYTSIVKDLDVSSLKLNALYSFETWGTDYSVTRRH